MPLHSGLVFRFRSVREVPAEVMQENLNAPLLRFLRTIVSGPVLLIRLPLGKRNRLRLDYGSVRQDIALVDDRGGVEVFAGEAALNVVRASAGLRLQVDAVNVAVVGRLTRHKPGAIGKAVEPTGCRDDEAAFFSWSHGRCSWSLCLP
jgi:hypothetical protein